jgi:hypothetical protein
MWQLAENTTSQSQIYATNNLLHGENHYEDGNILAITGDSAVIGNPRFISDTRLSPWRGITCHKYGDHDGSPRIRF